MKNPKEVRKRIKDEIQEITDFNSSFEIISVDTEKQEVLVKFNYHEVDEDDYIGLQSY